MGTMCTKVNTGKKLKHSKDSHKNILKNNENMNERTLKYKPINAFFPKSALLSLRTELFWNINENPEPTTPRWKSI